MGGPSNPSNHETHTRDSCCITVRAPAARLARCRCFAGAETERALCFLRHAAGLLDGLLRRHQCAHTQLGCIFPSRYSARCRHLPDTGLLSASCRPDERPIRASPRHDEQRLPVQADGQVRRGNLSRRWLHDRLCRQMAPRQRQKELRPDLRIPAARHSLRCLSFRARSFPNHGHRSQVHRREEQGKGTLDVVRLVDMASFALQGSSGTCGNTSPRSPFLPTYRRARLRSAQQNACRIITA